LLFSDPSAFRIAFPDAVDAIEKLTKTAQSVVSPEHIDDNQPPSQRIAALLPGFAKTVHGPTVAAHNGLANQRSYFPT
jgi:hypothetical protein